MIYPAHGLQTPPTELTELDGDLGAIRKPATYTHAVVIDLRSTDDFKAAHIPGAKNIDVKCAATENPFKCPKTLAELWQMLRQVLVPEVKSLCNKSVLLVSYDEEVAYVGSSVLRKEGVKAFVLGGGFDSWKVTGLETCVA
jgi:rhodanese-related sulfurtransferase